MHWDAIRSAFYPLKDRTTGDDSYPMSACRIGPGPPSSTFTNFIEVGGNVGIDSYAYKAYEGRPLPDDMQEVPAEEWIKSSWLRQDAVVSEQSLPMPYV